MTESAPDWRARMRELGITPSKGMGQNFLHDAGVVRRIVAAADIGPHVDVLEIGPGLGIMTGELAARARRVVAIELDDQLAAYLPNVLPANVSIIHADALDVDPAQFFDGAYRVVANLPYSVGTAIVRHLLEAERPAVTISVMLQREVAERIVAVPPEMSLLAVGVQFFGVPRLLFRIGGGAFIPAPRVESAVVQITTQTPPLPREEWKPFFDVVQAGFGQKRKQLVNSLGAGLLLERAVLIEAMDAANIPSTERAERLTIDDWLRLYQALIPYRSGGLR